jgi:hypothetical protein
VPSRSATCCRSASEALRLSSSVASPSRVSTAVCAVL